MLKRRVKPVDNPYDPPSESSPSVSAVRPLPVRHHILRNLISSSLCLLGYCLMDFFHVRHGPPSVGWAEPWFLPVFFGATLFANRGLFHNNAHWILRWCAICSVSLLIVVVGGHVLMTLGIWFHFAIGGTL